MTDGVLSVILFSGSENCLKKNRKWSEKDGKEKQMSNFKDFSCFLEESMKVGPLGNGCAVARDGEILFEEYHGFADREKKIPMSQESVFRQFSTTKLVTSTAGLMLYERGKFLLNDPLYEYFPEWKHTMVAETQADGNVVIRPANRPILIRDCFSMAMGIGYGGEDYTHQMLQKVREDLRRDVGDYTLRQEVRAISSIPVAFDPGTRWRYGVGLDLVAALIEEVSGKRLSEFMREEIFEPLGMKDTGHHYFGNVRDRMVTVYELQDAGEPKALPGYEDDENFEPDAKYEGGGVGLFSTVRDYIAFTQMLACGGVYKGERIIGRKTIDLMRTNQLNDQQLKDFYSPYLEGYGYGLGVRTLLKPAAGVNASPGEFGWTGMLGTYVSIDPSEKLSIVYMHNLVPNKEAYIHPRIRNIVYGSL